MPKKTVITFPPSDEGSDLDNGLAGTLRVEITVNDAGRSAGLATNGRAVGIAPGSREEIVLNAFCDLLLALLLAGVDFSSDAALVEIRRAFDSAMYWVDPHPADVGLLEDDPHGLPLE